MEDWNKKLENSPDFGTEFIENEEDIIKDYINNHLINLVIKKIKRDKKNSNGKKKKYIEELLEYIKDIQNI